MILFYGWWDGGGEEYLHKEFSSNVQMKVNFYFFFAVGGGGGGGGQENCWEKTGARAKARGRNFKTLAF